MRKHLLFGFLSLAILGITIAAQTINQNPPRPSGIILGKLLDSTGQPVAGATVTANFQGASRGIMPYTRTDQQGNFTITHVHPGTYTMEAEKKEDGYPPTDSFYYTREELKELNQPVVEVQEQQIIRAVVVHLGKKGAWVAGRIIDATTQKRLGRAALYFKSASGSMGTIAQEEDRTEEDQRDGQFKLLVPSAPFTFEVTADGYEKWIYSNDSSGKHEEKLQLKSGEVREFKIALRPISPAGSSK